MQKFVTEIFKVKIGLSTEDVWFIPGQIHQIHVKSKILKSLKFSPFDNLIENRKFPTFQLHSPSDSGFLTILVIFLVDLRTKCDLEDFQGTIKIQKTK